MRALLLIALAGFLAPAWATNTNKPLTLSQISARNVEAKYGSADSIWRTTGTGHTAPAAVTPAGSVVLTSNYKGPSPLAGQVIDIGVKRTLPWASISRAVAKSLPLVSTALAIKEIADAIRCREAVGGGAECDAGTAEVSVETRCYAAGQVSSTWGGVSNPNPQFCGANAGVVGALFVAWANSSNMGDGGYGHTCSSWNSFNVQVYELASSTATTFTMNRKTYRNNNGPGNCSPSDLIGTYSDGPHGTSATTNLACPSVVVNGVTLFPVKGPDGKCMTNVYAPASEDAVATKAETYGDKTKAPLVVGELNQADKPIDHPFPEIDPVPASVTGPRETTQHPDGSTQIRDTVWDLAPTPTGYEWTPRTITKDYPPGATIPPPGTVSDGTTTTGAPPQEEIITCGLPNTPPCKIDEGGTPPPSDPFEPNPSSWFDPIRNLFASPDVADTSWTFTFQLPTGCQTLTVGPFLTQTVEVDLCQYQPMIHDFMSIIWLMTGAWVCIGMVGRTLGGS